LSLNDLGNIGELVAALATVATLAYLALQIRQNTRSLRAGAFQDATRSANDWGALFIDHPETTKLFRNGLSDPNALEPHELTEFTHILETFLRNYRAARRLSLDGLIPVEICNIYETRLKRWLMSPEFREWCRGQPHFQFEDLRELIDAAAAA